MAANKTVGQDPGRVPVEEGLPPPPTTSAEQDRQTAGERAIAAVAPPKTSRAEDEEAAGLRAANEARAEGQREVSRSWESTQRIIAIGCVFIGLGISAYEILRQGSMQETAMTFITALVTMVVSTFFTRSNHTRVGGPGGDSAGTR